MPIETIYTNDINNTKMSLHLKKSIGHISACEIYKKKELVLVGISLGNSYFNEDRLKFILSGFCKTFERVAVLLVDDLAIHNYKAMGHSDTKAKKKLRKDSSLAYNRIHRAIEYAQAQYNLNNIKFYQWRDIEASSPYQESLKLITDMYNTDSDFSSEINKSTFDVMEKYTSETNTKDYIINEAKWYFLKELAFVHSASDFFESPLLTSYYTDLPIFSKLLSFGCLSEDEKHGSVIYECSLD